MHAIFSRKKTVHITHGTNRESLCTVDSMYENVYKKYETPTSKTVHTSSTLQSKLPCSKLSILRLNSSTRAALFKAPIN